jgi:hypothetical protein
MRSFRFSVVKVVALGAVFSSFNGSSGCAESSQCPRPLGAFAGTYRPISGNCTSVKSRDLVFSNDPEESVQTITMTLSDSVTTEVNLIGCTIAVEQSISTAKEKKMIAHLEGNLAVEDARALTGRLTYQEYLADGMTQSCWSEVEVSYVQQNVGGTVTLAGGGQATIGAAAEAALASP